MRIHFFKMAKNTAVALPLSFFSFIYLKAFVQTYQENIKHQQRLKRWEQEGFKPVDKSVWELFVNAYFPLLPLKKPTNDQPKETEKSASNKP